MDVRVLVTGVGGICALGRSFREIVESAIVGRSGVRLDTETYAKPYLVARVPSSPDSDNGTGRPFLDRVSILALDAVEQAIRDSAIPRDLLADGSTGVYFGSGFGGAQAIEDGYRAVFCGSGRTRPSTVPAAMTNAAAAHIAMAHGVIGPVMTFATACASSALAVGEAFLALRQRRLQRAIVVGSEALLTNGLLAAWDSLRVLAAIDQSAPARSCKPFSRNRSGFVLGEGAAALVLESSRSLSDSARHVYGEIRGYGISCDASHLTTPTVAGQVRAMRAALEDAGLAASQLDYINAHGTATPIGDRVETDAIKQALGSAARDVLISSTKAIHGHLLGAAGVLEVAICLGAIQEGAVPPTMHLDQPDTACDLDYVPNIARRFNVRMAMSNSFAFGGTNVCLVVGRPSA